MSNNDLAVVDSGDIMEAVIAKGDLSKLTPAERAMYYTKTCDSMGLNSLTQPFQYINLNGKLTLYATRTATDQLRKINGVSVTAIARETTPDGAHIVTVRVRDNSGREDEEIGAVSIAGLKGDALANALMKATTKAKRRATLSICGLGWLDESEIETIPGARTGPIITEVIDNDTGEIVNTSDSEVSKPSAAMRKLHAIANERGISHDQLHDMAAEQFGVRSMKELAAKQLAELAVRVEHEVADQDTGKIILDEYLAAIYSAETTEQLQKIAATLKDVGISDQTLRDAWASRVRELAKQPALAAV